MNFKYNTIKIAITRLIHNKTSIMPVIVPIRLAMGPSEEQLP